MYVCIHLGWKLSWVNVLGMLLLLLADHVVPSYCNLLLGFGFGPLFERKLETVGYIATLGHEFLCVGAVQFDIVIVAGFAQEAGRVCTYVCVCAFGIIWVEILIWWV